jgi:hypothetical protein
MADVAGNAAATGAAGRAITSGLASAAATVCCTSSTTSARRSSATAGCGSAGEAASCGLEASAAPCELALVVTASLAPARGALDERIRPQHLGRCEGRHGWHHPAETQTNGQIPA